MSLPGFTETQFSYAGVARTVYRRGQGPGVVIIHEVPGITPQVAAFGERVADAGFTAVLPSLFGTPGKPLSVGYVAGQFTRCCISREFRAFAAREESPIIEWVRALCRAVHAELGGKGIGALGMCFTGNFALALMVDPFVMAPVLSQPSLPLPITRSRRDGLGVSDATLAAVKERVASGARVLGLRFSADPICTAERFARLSAELGDGFEKIEIDNAKGNPNGIHRAAHSVLTNDLVDKDGHPTRAALERVLAFFHEQLKG